MPPLTDVVADAAEIVEEAAIVTADLAEAAIEPARSAVVHIRAEIVDGAGAVANEAREGAEALSAFSAKMADAIRVTFEDSVSFVAALLAVRSLPEVVSVNTEHLNRRMETLATQGRELTLLAQKVAMRAWRAGSIG